MFASGDHFDDDPGAGRQPGRHGESAGQRQGQIHERVQQFSTCPTFAQSGDHRRERHAKQRIHAPRRNDHPRSRTGGMKLNSTPTEATMTNDVKMLILMNSPLRDEHVKQPDVLVVE